MGVDVSSDGVVMGVDKLEREWRANFFCGICEGKASQMLLEDKGSSRVFAGGKWSPKRCV